MKISDGEKLILLMLSELYDRLGIEGDIDPDFIRSAIYSDNLWGLRWKYTGIPFERQRDPDIVKEVIDVLDMWSFIELSYERLSVEDKTKVEEQAYPFGKDPKFTGFDGNNESEHLCIAHFIIDDLDRFESFKGRDLNSHSPLLGAYRRMLEVYMQIRRTLAYHPLTAVNIVNLLNEMIHPENR